MYNGHIVHITANREGWRVTCNGADSGKTRLPTLTAALAAAKIPHEAVPRFASQLEVENQATPDAANTAEPDAAKDGKTKAKK